MSSVESRLHFPLRLLEQQVLGNQVRQNESPRWVGGNGPFGVCNKWVISWLTSEKGTCQGRFPPPAARSQNHILTHAERNLGMIQHFWEVTFSPCFQLLYLKKPKCTKRHLETKSGLEHWFLVSGTLFFHYGLHFIELAFFLRIFKARAWWCRLG